MGQFCQPQRRSVVDCKIFVRNCRSYVLMPSRHQDLRLARSRMLALVRRLQAGETLSPVQTQQLRDFIDLRTCPPVPPCDFVGPSVNSPQ
jgi:hypothetical protein